MEAKTSSEIEAWVFPSLKNMDKDEDDDGPRNLNKPDGDKKTKEKIKREHEASSLRDKIDAMVQSMS